MSWVCGHMEDKHIWSTGSYSRWDKKSWRLKCAGVKPNKVGRDWHSWQRKQHMCNNNAFRQLSLVHLGLRHKEGGAVGNEDRDTSRSQSKKSLNVKPRMLDPVWREFFLNLFCEWDNPLWLQALCKLKLSSWPRSGLRYDLTVVKTPPLHFKALHFCSLLNIYLLYSWCHPG